MMYKTNKIFNEILKLSKFSINGAIAVLVDIIVYSIIVTFPVKSVIAQPISVAVGLTVSYFLNKKITFKSDKKIFSNEIVKYIISSIFIIFISPFFIVFYSKFIKNEYYVKKLSSGADDDFPEKFPIFMYAIRRVNEDGARTLLDTARKLKETNAAVTISSLAIDGRDAALAGFFGADIGRALTSLLDRVMRGEIKNEREELLSVLKDMKNTASKRGAPHEC